MPEGKKKREIQPVEGRSDKHRTYQEQIRRYKKAMENGFFCEAIVIDYACMEDRLRYMLFYLGVLQNEDDISVKGKSSRVNEFRIILREYEGDKENLGIGSISGKRKIIRSIFRMASEPVKPKNGDAIRQLLWTSLHHEQHDGEILQILQDMEDWCKYKCYIRDLKNKGMRW